MDKMHRTTVFAHGAVGNEQCTQAATVAKLNLGHIDNQFGTCLRFTENEKFCFQFRGDSRIQFPDVEFEYCCFIVRRRTESPLRRRD